MPSPYSSIRLPASTIDGFREISIKPAEKFLACKSLTPTEATKNIDEILFELIDKSAENAEPLLCLRCRVSHPIFLAVISLYKKHKGLHSGLEKEDMLACVLNDGGALYLTDKNNNGLFRNVRMVLNWNKFTDMQDKGYLPFGVEVIQTFNPNRKVLLSTWASRKIKGNAAFKKYCRTQGLIFYSDWSLLNDSSSTRWINACQADGMSSDQLSCLKELQASYCPVYKIEKEKYRKETGKSYGWEPEAEFLESLTPRQDSFDFLHQIALAIRRYETLADTKLLADEDEIILLKDIQSLFDDKELLDLINTTLNRVAFQILKQAIQKKSLKWEKKPERKLCWELYSQGLTTYEIASRCNKKQSWASKRLEEKTSC